MIIKKQWAMPNKSTFTIKPIKELILRYFGDTDTRHNGLIRIDPFVNNSPLKHHCEYTNDIDTEIQANSNIDALAFLKGFTGSSVDLVLFDPPYSPRQVSECYKSLGMTVNMQTTQSSFWGDMKKEVARVVSPGGIVITCGWNSGGIGKTLGFKQIEILLCAHGGWHNDTIVTVETKNESQDK